jgi:hypothetical protein
MASTDTGSLHRVCLAPMTGPGVARSRRLLPARISVCYRMPQRRGEDSFVTMHLPTQRQSRDQPAVLLSLLDQGLCRQRPLAGLMRTMKIDGSQAKWFSIGGSGMFPQLPPGPQNENSSAGGLPNVSFVLSMIRSGRNKPESLWDYSFFRLGTQQAAGESLSCTRRGCTRRGFDFPACSGQS